MHFLCSLDRHMEKGHLADSDVHTVSLVTEMVHERIL